MLTLRRREGERIVILVAGERIEIELVSIQGRYVKTASLGFEATRAVQIFREEISPIDPDKEVACA